MFLQGRRAAFIPYPLVPSAVVSERLVILKPLAYITLVLDDAIPR